MSWQKARNNCKAKVRYECKKDAQTALNTLKSYNGKEGERRLYGCPVCRGWHMSNPEKKSKAEPVKLIMEDKWKKILDNEDNEQGVEKG